MRSTPTLKQKKWVKLLSTSNNLTEAGMLAYNTNSRRNAYQYSYKNMHNPTVLSYMENILNESGLNDNYLAKKLKTVIDKSVTRTSLRYVQPSDGLRAIEMVFRLKDKFPSERLNINKQELKLQLDSKNVTELLDTLKQVTEEATSYHSLLVTDNNVTNNNDDKVLAPSNIE